MLSRTLGSVRRASNALSGTATRSWLVAAPFHRTLIAISSCRERVTSWISSRSICFRSRGVVRG